MKAKQESPAPSKSKKYNFDTWFLNFVNKIEITSPAKKKGIVMSR
jgi:hypothetical protein